MSSTIGREIFYIILRNGTLEELWITDAGQCYQVGLMAIYYSTADAEAACRPGDKIVSVTLEHVGERRVTVKSTGNVTVIRPKSVRVAASQTARPSWWQRLCCWLSGE